MIKIQGKDKANWTRDDGIVINWDNYAIKYKDDRVRPSFLAPEVVQDSWDGKETDIQHVRYDGRTIEITTKESEIDFISYLKSFDEIIITDFEMNESSTVINQTYTVDMTKSDNFDISEEENIGQTSGAKYIFKFRTNRTVINKGLPVDNTNTISFVDETRAWKLNVLAEIDTSYGKIARLNDNSVAYFDGSSLYKFKIAENEFVQVGASLAIPFASINDITALDEDSVALIYDSQGLLQKYTFSSGTWASTGNLLNIAGNVTEPVICSLSSSRVAIFDNTLGELRAYDFDGTDWAQVGSSFTLTTGATTYDICKMTSSKIAIAVASGNYLRSYDFNGSVFSLDQSLTINSMVNISISRLSDSRVVIIDGGTDTLRSYTLSGTWSADVGSLSLSSSIPICEALSENNVFVHNSTSDGFYVYGQFDYYSDYDVLDYFKDTEDVKINWYDGTEKTAIKTSKSGLEYLQYIITSDYDLFLDRLKNSGTIEINSTEITEIEYESSNIADGIWKIIVRGVSSTDKIVNDLNPNESFDMTMNSDVITYSSDYAIYPTIRESEDITIEWDDGSIKRMQTVAKYELPFIYYTDSPTSIILDIKAYNDIKINTAPVTEVTYTLEEIDIGFYKITIRGVFVNTVTTLYNFPTSGTALIITDETPEVHTYYTDFDVMLIAESSEKNTIKNQTGINTTTKSISKQVKQVKFILNEAWAFNLKLFCELFKPGWTCTLAGSTVYEITNSDNIEPIKLGVDLYEVNVNCLMDTTTN